MISAAFLLAAAVAAPGSGFGLSLSPAVVTGPASSTATFSITDVGTTPLTLHMRVVEERPANGGHLWVPWKPYGQATLSPATFKLQPGQLRTVKVVIRSTDGLHHRLAIAAEAQQAAVRTGAAVTPSVAAAYTVTGAPNPYPHTVVAQPVKPSPPFDFGPVWVGLLLAAALGALVLAARKLKISRR